MIAIRILTVGLSLFALSFALSQEVDKSDVYEKKASQNKSLAREAVRTNNIYLAIIYYERNYCLDSTDIRTWEALAPLYFRTHNYPKAEKFYTLLVASKSLKKHPEHLYFLALSEKAQGKYAKAQSNLLAFKKKASQVDDPAIKKLYKKELEGCEMALATPDPPGEFVVRNIGTSVNQPHIEFSPIPYGEEGMIFGSLTEQKERIYDLSIDSIAFPRRRLFVAEEIEGSWYKAGLFKGPFSTDDSDIGNGCFSIDSSRFYFTRCKEDKVGKMICKIYVSTLDGKTWSEPELLDETVNMEGYTASHPTLGRESKRNYDVLYFVSDREGTKGGMDLWCSVYDARKKVYKKARNCGSRINTPGDEMTPFYDIQTKTLYFASNGHAGYGGFDIFRATGEVSRWENISNIGPDLNSSYDDLDYAFKPSGKGGYFVSNRPGGQSLYHPTCCDDIYAFTNTKYIDISTSICLKDSAGNPIQADLLSLYLVDSTGRTLVRSFVDADGCKRFELRPGMNYVVEGKKEGYFVNSLAISTEGIAQTTRIEKALTLDKQPAEAIVISDIKYDFDSPNLTQRSKNILDTTLVELFKKYPNLQFEISAHTDSKGTDAYNLKLSQKRAESVVRYLVSKGIPERQLVARGYGESQPIAPNENPDGTDNPEGREKNRRTAFKILGEIEEEIIDLQEEEE